MLMNATLGLSRSARGAARIGRVASCGAIAAMLLLAAGCGGNRVAGKVTLNGKPVKSGIVTFHADGNNQKVANINTDGEYRLDDPPQGTVKVCVQSLAIGVPVSPAGMPGKAGALLPAPPSPGEAIPPRYADPNNGLTFNGTSGNQKFDIELTQ